MFGLSRDLMEDKKITPISESRPYIKVEKIKSRFCRIWKSTPGTTQKYTSLHCILLDETEKILFYYFDEEL